MLDIIRSLLINLSVIVILSALIDIILPKNSYRKYTKFVFGLILLVVLIKPISHIFENEDTLSEMIFSNSIKLENQIITQQSEVFQKTQDEQIAQTYKDSLELSIASALNSTFELKNTSVEITFMGEENAINKIAITTAKNTANQNIEPIFIDLKQQNADIPNELDEREIDLIKSYLSELYNIKNEFIFINDK